MVLSDPSFTSSPGPVKNPEGRYIGFIFPPFQSELYNKRTGWDFSYNERVRKLFSCFCMTSRLNYNGETEKDGSTPTGPPPPIRRSKNPEAPICLLKTEGPAGRPCNDTHRVSPLFIFYLFDRF